MVTASSSFSSDSVSSPAPALERGLRILELMSVRSGSMNLAQICAELEMPRNSTLRLLQTLVSCGYLIREHSPPQYRMSDKLLRISQPHVGEKSLVECSLDVMRGLRDKVGETVQLGIPTGDEGVIIEKLESPSVIRIGVEIGLRFPLHNNAPGKVLLSFLPEKEREDTIERLALVRSTARTITSRNGLRKECSLITKQGYGVDWGEADEGIHCVAAPIRDRHGRLMATIWVSGIAGRMPRERFPEVGREVKAAAGIIEERIKE